MNISRIIERVEFDPFGGCWLWSGPLHYQRYPRLRIGAASKLIAREAWQAANGALTPGFVVTPQCGVLECVNPAHLSATPRFAARGVRRNAERLSVAAGTLQERLSAASQCDQISGCVIWTGAINGDGYGTLSHRGRTVRAHRVAYRLAGGRLIEGLVLDHLCRNRSCINPEHLEQVTPRENTLRGDSARKASQNHPAEAA